MKLYWYANGLHFECMQCGRCCSGPGEGYVGISRPETKFIADFLEIEPKQLRQKYLRRRGLWTTIIEHPTTRDCIFLRQINGQKRCAIYPVRPNQCRGWPFWPINLTGPETWNETAHKCPGINRGRFYSLEEIEKIKRQKNWWSDENQHSDCSVKRISKCHLDGSEAKRRDLFLNRFLHFGPLHGPSVEMTGGFSAKHAQILKRVAEVYNWLNRQILNNIDLAGQCDACGKCCNFGTSSAGTGQRFDHRLFITTPELMYLTANLGAENINPPHVRRIKPMPTTRSSTLSTMLKTSTLTTRCPYNNDGKCTIYEYRFVGCRIFCCRADADFQSKLSESALKKLKSICTEFELPYRYTDLASALNSSRD